MGISEHLNNQTKEEKDIIDRLFSYRDKPLNSEILEGIKPYRYQAPNPIPFVRINDLNNQIEQDDIDDNPPKSAIEVGLKWRF